MKVRTSNVVLADLELYAELQRRGAIQNPDELLNLVKELRAIVGYGNEYHEVTQSAIGLSKMALLRNDPQMALESLQRVSNKIDDAIVKFFPESAQALGILNERNAVEPTTA